MTAVAYHFTTAAGNNLQPVRALNGAVLKGYSATNASTTVPQFIKLWWFTETSTTTEGPVVGTTPPNLTIGLNFGASPGFSQQQSWPDGITGNGQLWVAVTANAADTDNTNATAGSVITLLVE